MSHSEFWGLNFIMNLFLVADTIHPILISPASSTSFVKQRYGSARAEVSGPLLVLLLPSDIFFAIKKMSLLID